MRAGPALGALLLAALLPASGCVTYPPGWDVEERGRDPYEPVNRAIFGFNEGVDRFFLNPVAEGWEFVTPSFVRTGLDNFFTNLQFPRRLLANLGQGELIHAGSETGRFLVNTTMGVAGFWDAASWLGMELYDEDFGQMFGRWGVPPGPYWVVPVLGPSNPRDAFGSIFDLALDGRNAVTGLGFLATVNARAIADPQIEQAREAALDFYVFARDGYVVRRAAQVRDEPYQEELSAAAAPPDDLYDIDAALDDEDPFAADAALDAEEPGGADAAQDGEGPAGEDEGPAARDPLAGDEDHAAD